MQFLIVLHTQDGRTDYGVTVPCLPGCVSAGDTLAARGKSPAAFDRRCIPLICVVHRSNTTGILPLLALLSGRIADLGATRGFTTDC